MLYQIFLFSSKLYQIFLNQSKKKLFTIKLYIIYFYKYMNQQNFIKNFQNILKQLFIFQKKNYNIEHKQVLDVISFTNLKPLILFKVLKNITYNTLLIRKILMYQFQLHKLHTIFFLCINQILLHKNIKNIIFHKSENIFNFSIKSSYFLK